MIFKLTFGMPGATGWFLDYLNSPSNKKNMNWQVLTQTVRTQHLFLLNRTSLWLKTTTNLSHETNANLMMLHHGVI